MKENAPANGARMSHKLATRNHPFRVYFGHDSHEDIAYEVAKYSIEKHASVPVHVQPLKREELREQGLYRREQDPKQSTEFTYCRFFVPYLNNYKGWALFADDDFVWLEDVAELLDQVDDRYAVMCVQHDYSPSVKVKLAGVKQEAYPRKNWSSMVLYNCGHPANANLTLDVANQKPGSFLHRSAGSRTTPSSAPSTTSGTSSPSGTSPTATDACPRRCTTPRAGRGSRTTATSTTPRSGCDTSRNTRRRSQRRGRCARTSDSPSRKQTAGGVRQLGPVVVVGRRDRDETMRARGERGVGVDGDGCGSEAAVRPSAAGRRRARSRTNTRDYASRRSSSSFVALQSSSLSLCMSRPFFACASLAHLPRGSCPIPASTKRPLEATASALTKPLAGRHHSGASWRDPVRSRPPQPHRAVAAPARAKDPPRVTSPRR